MRVCLEVTSPSVFLSFSFSCASCLSVKPLQQLFRHALLMIDEPSNFLLSFRSPLCQCFFVYVSGKSFLSKLFPLVSVSLTRGERLETINHTEVRCTPMINLFLCSHPNRLVSLWFDASGSHHNCVFCLFVPKHFDSVSFVIVIYHTTSTSRSSFPKETDKKEACECWGKLNVYKLSIVRLLSVDTNTRTHTHLPSNEILITIHS